MIRFRFAEDEQRYLLLVGALQRQLATQLPPAQVSVAMRNLGKLQDLLLMEGVRQGATAACLNDALCSAGLGSLGPLKPLELHAAVYGAHDTPLHAIERRLLAPLGTAKGFPWLDEAPMQFAPTALQSDGDQTATPPAAVPKAWDDMMEDDIRQEAERYMTKRVAQDDDFRERPDLLDRARDVLIDMAKRGDPISSWTDMILRLHATLQVDAGFLDLQMSTPMGLTVLHQAGFHELRPPNLLDAQFWTLDPVPTAPASGDPSEGSP